MIVKISAKDGFIWDDSYLLGSELVDTQHHQLFDLVNSLVVSCISGSNKEKLKDTLDFLVNYTVQHFNDEEALQIDCNYPEYEQHKQLHEDFKLIVVGLVQRFNESGSSSKLCDDVKSIVIKWLVNHILTEDKKIGVHLEKNKLNKLGLHVPVILLPQANFDLQKWPVIACDQFTQDRDYWEKAKAAATGAPSTLNLIIPEVFLSDDDAAQRITGIHSTMKSYLSDGVFAPPRNGFIYIERDTPYQKKRRGLVAAIDLEQYDWKADARPLIRCTEGTVAERLPARMDIRRGAPLELPHVLLLIDDDTDSLLPALGEMAKKSAPVYNTQLMMDSGSITGWYLDTQINGPPSAIITLIIEKLNELCRRSDGGESSPPFLFAVGDGNHSLAAAKEIWEEIKAAHSGDGLPDHPCRYALVEIENIYDPAIQFEPIHRLVFDAGYDETVSILSQLPDFSCRSVGSAQELAKLVSGSQGNCFGVISEGKCALIETSAAGIATACLQPLLDKYAKDNPQLIDYIHDEKELFRLAENTDRRAAGILLPPVQKSGLFETVGRLGPLPRKSFSMGHSVEKRFYLECRSLF